MAAAYGCVQEVHACYMHVCVCVYVGGWVTLVGGCSCVSEWVTQNPNLKGGCVQKVRSYNVCTCVCVFFLWGVLLWVDARAWLDVLTPALISISVKRHRRLTSALYKAVFDVYATSNFPHLFHSLHYIILPFSFVLSSFLFFFFFPKRNSADMAFLFLMSFLHDLITVLSLILHTQRR